MHRGEGERTDCSAAAPPRERRRGRSPDAEGPRPQPGLAELCAHLARAKQDSPSHQFHRAQPGDRSGPPVARARSAASGTQPEENSGSGSVARVASEYGCAKLEDLFADLGYGKFSARQIISNALGEPIAAAKVRVPPKNARRGWCPTVKRMLRVGDATLQVGGQDDLMVFRAKCCNPIPGMRSSVT